MTDERLAALQLHQSHPTRITYAPRRQISEFSARAILPA